VTGPGREALAHGPAEIEAAAAAVRERTGLVPAVALVLGSGLGGYADGFADATAIPYGEIPGFPRSTVDGHKGRLVLGRVGETPVVALQGRFHPYEGWSASEVAFPLRVMHALGARVLVVTNAAGGVNHRFEPGDLMLIEDHVNFQFRSPLRGSGPLVDEDRFVDLCTPWSPRLRELARAAAARLGITGLHEGTYFGNLGPTYETKAEIRAIRALGGDAVGMSTVAEIVVAAHLGLETLGITCISNKAAGLSREALAHEDVIAVTGRMRETFTRLLDSLVPQLVSSQ
jgi:purine-nucleoside phosphorylase